MLYKQTLLFFFLISSYIGIALANDTIPPLLPTQTPLEVNEYQALPSSREVNDFLKAIDKASSHAQLVSLGRTAGKRPYNLLLVSKDQTFMLGRTDNTEKPTIMIIASLHGDEASGSEAAQLLIKQLLNGEHSAFLDDMNFVIFPLANPDGRDSLSRYNDNGADINRDFLTLRESESSHIVNAIHTYKPHALLDIHEASAFKQTLGGKEGYLTDFETQLETTSNPNIDAQLHEFSEKVFLPALIDQVKEKGLPAQRYRGAINSLNQPFVRASLSAGVLRNYGGIYGALSILQENRLDNEGEFSTPKNIQERSRKQLTAILAFLELVQQHKDDIIIIANNARDNWSSDGENAKQVTLVADFALDEAEAVVDIPLIQLSTGDAVTRPFVNYSAVLTSSPIELPPAYAITEQQTAVANILDKHNIDYDVLHQPTEYTGTSQRIKQITLNTPVNLGRRLDVRVELEPSIESLLLQPGDILVNTEQPLGVLLPILFDPRSSSSVFQTPEYRPLLLQYAESFLVPLNTASPPDEQE